MKNKIFIIILLLFMFLFFGIVSVQAKTCSDKNTLIKCSYKSTNSELSKFTLSINKNNELKVKSEGLKCHSSVGYGYKAQCDSNEVDSPNFVDNNGHYNCPNLLYVNSGLTSGTGKDQNAKHTHQIVSINNDGGTEAKLDKSKSCKAKNADDNMKSSKDIKKCYYDNNSIIIVINKKKKTFRANKTFLKINSSDKITYNDLTDGMCPSWVCRVGTDSSSKYSYSTGASWYMSYGAEEPKQGWNPVCYSGLVSGGKYKCITLNNYMGDVTSDNYKSKNEKTKEKYNSSREKVLTYCNAALGIYEYTKNKTQKTCIDECLKIRTDIAVIEADGGEDKCMISDKIIAFAYNILKWVRYIAPVLVIILGILDFIKALAAQDDDAMKKAQGRFIKRLIAATLLFLLPLIIDYLLNIFDLYHSECDITDMFS